MMKTWRPKVWLLVEQPASSWLFKQLSFQEVAPLWPLRKYLTNMGLFVADLLKPTHLYSNMSGLKSVERRATKKAKAKFQSRMKKKTEKLIQAGKLPPEYYRKTSDGRFHGGRDLSKSAVYPYPFIAAVYKAWQKQVGEIM